MGLNDKLIPVGRFNSTGDMPTLKPGMLLLKEGDQLNFDELYVGTSRGNSLINPRTVIKGAK